MNWEKTFRSIVDETDANLEKVKKTLRKNARPLSSSLRNTYTHSSFNNRATEKFDGMNTITPAQQSFWDRSQWSLNSSSSNPYSTPASDISVSKLNTLETRLQQQNKAIDQLTQIVRRLESERELYKQHMKDIQFEVSQLTSSLSHVGRDFVFDRRHDGVQAELDQLRSQLHALQTRENEDLDLTETRNLRYTREILQLRRDIQQDTDSLRQDLDSLRNRIVKMESGMTKQCQKTDYEKPSSSSLNRSFPSSSKSVRGSKSVGSLEVAELKNSVHLIRHKLDTMENYIQRSAEPKKSTSKLNGSDPPNYSSLPLDDLSDNESIADLADYDTTELTPPPQRKHQKSQPLDYDSDLDLDLNDLDLSDEDFNKDLIDDLPDDSSI